MKELDFEEARDLAIVILATAGVAIAGLSAALAIVELAV